MIDPKTDADVESGANDYESAGDYDPSNYPGD